MLCSGRSNYGLCDAAIQVDLRELETAVEASLQEVLDQCPSEELYHVEDSRTGELEELERKISRLVMALAESSEISANYISKEIDALHRKKEVLEAGLRKHRSPMTTQSRIDLREASFEEKRIIAREYLKKISIVGEEVNIEWKI